jgi:hypothetical protein
VNRAVYLHRLTIIKVSMVESATFNVGGHRYQVARTLLEQHPDTMLARSASQEIFME